MKIKVIGQDPSMNNWGLVAALVDTKDFTVEVIDMQTLVDITKDDMKKKTVRVSSRDLSKARSLSKRMSEFFTKHSDAKLTMVEVPHGSQSAASMKGYGICVGLLGAQVIPMIQLSEQECKVNAVGKKSTTKKEIIDWAMAQNPEANWKMRKSQGALVSVDGYNEHVADALSAVYAGINSDQFIQAVSWAEQLAS